MRGLEPGDRVERITAWRTWSPATRRRLLNSPHGSSKRHPEAITVFITPPAHRRRLRTTNGLERLNKEIKRRTRIAMLFPNKASLLRLASAVLS